MGTPKCNCVPVWSPDNSTKVLGMQGWYWGLKKNPTSGDKVWGGEKGLTVAGKKGYYAPIEELWIKYFDS
ncbi:hypothetical protein ACFLV7_03890 [Chloroflexota bacterium]